jgi:hypothetical protein
MSGNSRFPLFFSREWNLTFYKAIARFPDVLRLSRNGHPIEANRHHSGRIQITDSRLWVADPHFIDEVPALAVKCPNGEFDVFRYEWQHQNAPINVCLAIAFRPQSWAIARRLRIPTSIRPDLTDGIIVDFGQAAIRSASMITVDSGLGDGYYPVVAVFNYGIRLQSIIIDFKIWETRQIILLDESRTLDKYGIPVDKATDG